MGLKEFDTVRIRSLLGKDKAYDGTEAVMRAPRVRDKGILVHVYHGAENGMSYAVE